MGRGLTLDQHAERVAAYYDRNTRPFYLHRWHPDDIHFGLFPEGSDPVHHHNAVKRMTDAIIAPAAIRKKDRVLDAGCGIGGAALDIARTTGARVDGATISEVQVRTARTRARKAGLSDRVKFRRADCSSELPANDASVDVVVTIEAACHFADKPRFLRECRRVLRDGGRLAGTDWMAAEQATDDDTRTLLDPVCTAWRLAGLWTLTRWRASLAEAGFALVDSEDFGDRVLPNAKILAEDRFELALEAANGCHSKKTAALWLEQYDSLVRAWRARCFTIGRFYAVAA